MSNDTTLTPDVNQTPEPVLHLGYSERGASPWIVQHETGGRIASLLRAVVVDYQHSTSVLEELGIDAAYDALVLDDGATVSDAIVASSSLQLHKSSSMLFAAYRLGIPEAAAGSHHVSVFRMVNHELPVFLTEWRIFLHEPTAPACRCHARVLSRIQPDQNVTYKIRNADELEALLRKKNIVTNEYRNVVRFGKRATV
jgi:hypothetical protein